MRYQVFTAVESIEADSRLEAVEKFCNKQVVILVEEQVQESNAIRAHEFVRTLAGVLPPCECYTVCEGWTNKVCLQVNERQGG